MVDVLVSSDRAPAVISRLSGHAWMAPAHFDAEVISTLARLERAAVIGETTAGRAVAALHEAPVDRQPLPGLLAGAWTRRSGLRILDALYVELAEQFGCELITTDHRLARVVPWVRPVG